MSSHISCSTQDLHVGFMLGSCWVHVGFMLGSCWVHVGCGFMLGSCSYEAADLPVNSDIMWGS